MNAVALAFSPNTTPFNSSSTSLEPLGTLNITEPLLDSFRFQSADQRLAKLRENRGFSDSSFKNLKRLITPISPSHIPTAALKADSDFVAKSKKIMAHISAMTRLVGRIEDLKEYEEEVGAEISAASRLDLFHFCRKNTITKKPYVGLLENGNLRATWKDNGNQVAIQFKGNGLLQYVFFRRDVETGFIARNFGVDTAERVEAIVEAMELWTLTDKHD